MSAVFPKPVSNGCSFFCVFFSLNKKNQSLAIDVSIVSCCINQCRLSLKKIRVIVFNFKSWLDCLLLEFHLISILIRFLNNGELI